MILVSLETARSGISVYQLSKPLQQRIPKDNVFTYQRSMRKQWVVQLSLSNYFVRLTDYCMLALRYYASETASDGNNFLSFSSITGSYWSC